jgi:localization factor PodJL
MSNSDMSAERREGSEAPAPSDDGRDELKSMLDTIAAQLEDADRRHMAALGEMHERISEMGREADSLRARIPDQFAPAFEKIEAGIGELAHRLADPDRGSIRSGGASAYPALPSKSRGGADPFELWDQSSAEALAGAYEASGYRVPDATANDIGVEGSGTANIDEAWLESRFAEIARGIEYSLAHVKPEGEVSELGQRFEQFERQFAKLFAGVATHDDLSAVRQIEAHMEEVVHHLEKTNDQLERLSSVEAQLAEVSKTLAAMQAPPKGTSADIEAVARAVAEETAQRFAVTKFDARNSAADELRPLIEQLMAESRQGGQQTAALLDTMQQAMVRLLDRTEAIEFSQAPPRIFETDAPHFGGNTEMFGSDVVRIGDLPSGRDSEAVGETRESGSIPGGPSGPPLFSGYDAGLSPEEMAVRSEKLRQEFIADARRAKMRLSTEGDSLGGPLSPSRAAPQSPGAATTLAGSRPIRPSKRTAAKNTSGPSAPSPRLMFVAALVLVALAGLWYIFGFDNGPQSIAARSAAQGVTSQSKTDRPTGAPDAKAPSMPSDAPGGTNGTSVPGTNGPRGDLAPIGRSQNQAAASEAPSSETRTTLPMLGVAVDLDRPVTEAELQQARRHQAMANLSGELGSAASRPGGSASVPTSMVPTEAETEGIAPAPQGQAGGPQQSAAKSPPLDMPMAMIGPLSLRLAAANGDSSAQFEIGARFAEGEGVKQNFVEAAKWYQYSADQGFAQAQYRLGTLYERGLGLKADRGQATVWYMRAAEQGNIKSMHNLAVLSANQTDRSPDYESAAHWFTEAAKRGLPDSQFNLAVLYENGLGVTRDMKQAFLWLSLAAQGGDAEAVRRRDILRGKLTAQEIAETQKMIDTWRPTPSDRTVNDALAAGELWKKNPKNGISG